MKTCVKWGMAAALLASAPAANAETRVTVTGCPLPGVEANCLIIRGADNITYNISAANPRPQIGGRGISLSGTKTNKMSYCMQGVVLENIRWRYTEQNCARQ